MAIEGPVSGFWLKIASAGRIAFPNWTAYASSLFEASGSQYWGRESANENIGLANIREDSVPPALSAGQGLVVPGIDSGCPDVLNDLSYDVPVEGKVYGIDHSAESVAMATRTNKQWIDIQRVEVREASVSRLPFSDGAFDAITAVETHFWWPALPTDLREVLRVLKSGGRLIIIAEVYKGAESFTSRAAERYSEKTGMALLSVEEHRELLTDAGYSDVQVITEPSKGWICCIGSRASDS